jgi:hypothetical protein
LLGIRTHIKTPTGLKTNKGHKTSDIDAPCFRYALYNYKRVGELSTHGVGPHQALLLSDNQTLVVANGGLLAAPSHAKKILMKIFLNHL